MKREDFIFDHMDDEYEDYWFKVVGDTKDELTKKYMEMCMVSVTEVVYSNKEQVLGIKRLFPFNYDVIMPDDTELKDMLESLVNDDGTFEAKSRWTDIFIYPGYTFKAMDGLITNFHLPESTLVMLVSAFAGREHVLNAYEEAVKQRYRFFSFGDAMCIV